jgi:hypothetical protein
MKKFLIALTACFIFIALIVNTSALAEPKDNLIIPTPKPTYAEYENARAELYDAALDIITITREYYYECDSSERDWCLYADISEVNRSVIENYRVPDLSVLLEAIDEMDEASCLADAFDEPLIRFDHARERYDKMTKILFQCEEK